MTNQQRAQWVSHDSEETGAPAPHRRENTLDELHFHAPKTSSKTMNTPTVAKLSSTEPMRFDKANLLTINNNLPRAEPVEENADKSSATGSFGP